MTIGSTPGDDPSTALRALARLARSHGFQLEPTQLRRSQPFDSDEPSTARLEKIAQHAGFTSRKLRLKPGELDQLANVAPALLLLKDGKVALLLKVKAGEGATLALVEDLNAPVGTELLIDEPRLFQIWDGDVLLVKPQWKLTDQNQPFDFRWLVGAVLREQHIFRKIAVAAFLISLLSLGPPMMGMVIIDRVLYNHNIDTLYVLAAAILAIILFETLFIWLRKRLTAMASVRIDAVINLHVFDKVLNLPLSYFEQNSTGRVTGNISQVWHVRTFLVEVVAGTLLDGITLLVLLPVLIMLNWQLTAVVLVISSFILCIYVVYLPALRLRYGRVIEAETRMGSHLVETIHGIKTVKSLSLDGLKRQQRDQLVAGVAEAKRDYEFMQARPQTLVLPLERLIYASTFVLGAWMALTGATDASMGGVLAFAMLAGRVTGPLIQLANLINAYEMARGAMGTVGSVLNHPPEEGRGGMGLRQPITGHIVFDKVKFKYTPTAPLALNEASFEIPKGTIFGVMGRSGSGKTTITRLLQGLSREYEGLIKIDGMDLREIDLDHLRANIGVVPQENYLFSGTVRDNIAAARPKVSFDQVVKVAQLAGAEEFIERMPDGYATAVQEGAVNFSGGQRQRMAIARALLVDPPILVLDEATSALDAESEAIVNANLMHIAKGRTVIIISHRLSALMMADNILVMERGKVYDIGRHEELVQRCDIYKTLWHQQNRHLDPQGQHAHG
jgi:ATP-binding cassette subfamily B protein